MYVCVCKILSILFSSNITWHTYYDKLDKLSGWLQTQFKSSIADFSGLRCLLSVLLVSATRKSVQLHPINMPRFWVNGFNLTNILDSTPKGFPPDACSFHIPLTGLKTYVLHKTVLHNIRAVSVDYLHHMKTKFTQYKLFYGEHEMRVLNFLTYYVTKYIFQRHTKTSFKPCQFSLYCCLIIMA